MLVESTRDPSGTIRRINDVHVEELAEGQGHPKVRELMSSEVLSVGPGAHALEARSLLNARGVQHVLVMEHGDLRGILCSCDLWNARPWDRLYWMMSRRVLTIDSRSSIYTAAKTMLQTGVGCLPVTQGTRVRGVITREDLARAGIGLEMTGAICVSCRSHRHVPNRGSRTAVKMCLECLQRAVPPESEQDRLYVDLGAGG